MSEKSKTTSITEANHYQDANAPWLEWKDSDLNNEKWGTPRNGPDGLFLDTEHIMMPRSLEPYQWIRARDLKHLTDSLTVYTMAVGYPDLIMRNKHLLHSEFVRWFISALTNLQHCGHEGLEISGENPNFVWASRHESWHGWLHVYSMNKAGKGVQHRPVINPNGKYIVRLHYMGYWRRVLIDDTVPVDKGGRPLLPRTSNNAELWPILLAKALLKIASLSWTGHCEIVDFHPIACLTGWTCLTLNITRLSSQDKWDLLTKYSEHFEWTPRTASGYISKSTKSATSNKTRKSNETLRLLAETEKPQPISLFLLLRDMRELGNDGVPGLSPCWDHVIHIVQSRDIPLDPKDVKPPLERWKLHRWLKWAISQNIIDPADYFVPIRYLRVVSSFEEYNESIVYNVNDEVDAKEYSVAPSEIKQSDKIARTTKSQNTTNLFTTTMNEETGDVSRWIDFHKLAPYVTEVHIFYKLENFQWSVQVAGDVIKTIDEDHKAIGMTEIKKEKRDINDSPSKVRKARDEPLYLFCDSLKEKLFLISLCAAPKEKDVDSCKKDYLILEKYNFFKSDQLDQLAIISTIGTRSTIIKLEAGRQLLRIYRRSKSSLTVICSDTAFHLGNRAAVQQLMTAESQKIKQISKLISESLREAYRSFGNKDYPVVLKDYYRSYMPSSRDASSGKINKNLRTSIHYIFMEEQIRLIRQIFFDDDLRNILHALRVFFLNPDIRLEYFDTVRIPNTHQNPAAGKNSRVWYSLGSNRHEDILDYNQAATIIQSFFKMVLIKKYKYLHDPNHVLHMQVRGELSKISDLFDSSLISQLLRNIIKRHNGLHDLYPYSKDFVHVLNIQEFGGVLKHVKYDQWFPIARVVINSAPAKIVFAAFELLTDLPRFALRVFNNQNRREMKRIVNQVAPCRYKYHPGGYTIFAYGCSEKRRFKEIDWTIRIVTMKGEPMFHQMNEERTSSSEIEPPELAVKELTAVYIPNAKNCISRWRLRAISGGIISIRLTTSYSMVEIRMKITDKEGNVLANVDGGSTVLIPLAILKQSARNNEKHREVKDESLGVNEELKNAKKSLYYVEAFVLNNSWPLTEDEWTVVNRIKAKSTEDLKTKMHYAGNAVSSRSDLSTTRRDSRQSANDGQALESPYWILQIITDAKGAVEVCQDTSREQEIALLKESSCSRDRDRSNRGRKLREAFLNTQISKIKSEEFLQQDKERSEIMESDDAIFCLPRARQRRISKSPEFHRLPALNLTKYMSGDDVTANRWTKTESDKETSRNQRINDIIDSQKSYSDHLQKLTELTSKQFRKYSELFSKNEQNFWERRALMDAAYESRKAYIDTLTSVRTKIKGKNEKKK